MPTNFICVVKFYVDIETFIQLQPPPPPPSAPPPPSITSNWTEDENQSLNSLGATATAKVTKTIYIKKVEVTLNGVPLDLVEDKETEDEVY